MILGWIAGIEDKELQKLAEKNRRMLSFAFSEHSNTKISPIVVECFA